MVGERLLERVRDLARDACERGVQHRRVLALDQADRADLVAQRDGDVVAEHLVGELARRQLVLGRDRREHARDRHGLGRLADALEEARGGVAVERRDLAAVDLGAAPDDRLARGDGTPQILRPREQRRHRARGGSTQPQHGDALEPPALEQRVRRVGRAEHDVRDPAGIDGDRLEHLRERSADATRDVGGRRRLGPAQHAVVAVEHHRVRVRASHVDPDAQVRPTHAAPRSARSRSRSRRRAGRPSRSRAASARSGRRRTRSP